MSACGPQTSVSDYPSEYAETDDDIVCIEPVDPNLMVFQYAKDCRPADGFDYPVGPPNARGYYDAQPFGENTHLGSDWNGNGGGNSDYGDPVYAVADGVVFWARDEGAGWGNVLRIVHNAGTDSVPVFVESLYGHLSNLRVALGENVARGQEIGAIGNADGAYYAHLHLEIRDSLGMEVGGGYSRDQRGFVNPTKFIQTHRP